MQPGVLHVLTGTPTQGELIFWIIAVLAAYFIPFWVALARSSDQPLKVFLTNLLGGWTIFGWADALKLAIRS